MYRYALNFLKTWKEKSRRKPLIIEGARQVGKTWLMKEFARTAFTNSIYINFDNNKYMKEIFSLDFNITRILKAIELYSDKEINENTLLIFDEIQEVPEALACLKYFYENAPQYYIICAGSLLGIALHSGTSFPVGKLDFLKLYPLSFKEFLSALGHNRFINLLENINSEESFKMLSPFQDLLIEALKQYYYIGGMPEAVLSFSEERNFTSVRQIQTNILNAYEQDFSKHAPYEIVPKIRMIWNSIPSQLAKENKKFIYGMIREGARAKEFETALLWLIDCGLLHKVSRITQAHIPLKAYLDTKAFKLFTLDVGLLACMTGLTHRSLLEGNSLFKEFKGALTEQYVLQQMKSISASMNNSFTSYYYTNEHNSSEIDFLIDTGEEIIPIEVKAEVNLKAKSLKAYREKYNPQKAIRTSMTPYKEEQGLINLPLYAFSRLEYML